MTLTRHEVYSKAKVGVMAGLVGGFALFASFFIIDAQLEVPMGTFYKMIGLSVGLDGMPAIIFGWVAHMLTAATIGAVFCVCSILHRALNLTSVPKGILGGTITGIEVYAIFFLPITMFVMFPMISGYALGIYQSSPDEMIIAQTLMNNSDYMIWGSFTLHVIFGAIMGLFGSMVIHEDYEKKIPRKMPKMSDMEKEFWSSV